MMQIHMVLQQEDYGGGLFGKGQGQGTSVRYACLTCNHRFKGGDCPRCGSKMKRADF